MKVTRKLGLVVFSGLACVRPGLGVEPLVEEKDRTVARKAGLQAKDLCQLSDGGTIKSADLPEYSTYQMQESAKEDLKFASGDNWALQHMKGAKDMDEVTKNMQNDVSSIALRAGGPLAACVLSILVWFFVCWSAWPCCARRCKKCRGCRCYAGKHTRACIHPCKLFSGMFILAAAVGIALAALYCSGGFKKASDGFKGTSCTGSKLLNATLSGNQQPYFMGVLPSLDLLDELVQSLDKKSKFIVNIEMVLADTKEIDEAVTLAAGTLTLLKDMMANNRNKVPSRSDLSSLLHECMLCPELDKALTPAIDALNNGVAVKLKEARAEVEAQLTGTALTDLQGTVKESTDPLKSLKGMFVESFGWMVDTTLLQDLSSNSDKFGVFACLGLVLLAALITCCASSSLGFWYCQGKRTPRSCTRVVGTPRSRVHRCACTAWCCGCFYMWLAFFISGIMVLVAVPMASFCLVLDDVSGKMLDDISGAVGLNISGDQGVMTKDFVDQCFRNPDKTANPVMLDLIFTRDHNGKKVTLRKTIVEDTKDKINGKFDEISKSMAVKGMDMSGDANLVKLKNMLNDSPMSGMMRIPSSFDFSTSHYKDMANSTYTSLSAFWLSSGDCNDFLVPPNTGSLSGQSIGGLTNFSKTLARDFGVNPNPTITAPNCARKVTCRASLSVQEQTHCNVSNDFMQLKQDLRSTNTFKCKLFKDPANVAAKCDVKNMTESGTGQYSNDCMKTDGTLDTLEYSCTLAEFTVLVQGFSARIDKVFARLDKSARTTMNGINVNMKGLVDTEVTGKITKFADGVKCGYLGTTYQDFIESACYSGVVGYTEIAYSYVACGLLIVLVATIMYVVWRITLDNYNAYLQEEKERVIREAEEAAAAEKARIAEEARAAEEAAQERVRLEEAAKVKERLDAQAAEDRIKAEQDRKEADAQAKAEAEAKAREEAKAKAKAKKEAEAISKELVRGHLDKDMLREALEKARQFNKTCDIKEVRFGKDQLDHWKEALAHLEAKAEADIKRSEEEAAEEARRAEEEAQEAERLAEEQSARLEEEMQAAKRAQEEAEARAREAVRLEAEEAARSPAHKIAASVADGVVALDSNARLLSTALLPDSTVTREDIIQNVDRYRSMLLNRTGALPCCSRPVTLDDSVGEDLPRPV